LLQYGEDHGQWLQLASQRIKGQAQGFQREGTQNRESHQTLLSGDDGHPRLP
jgi:hypothetical protein